MAARENFSPDAHRAASELSRFRLISRDTVCRLSLVYEVATSIRLSDVGTLLSSLKGRRQDGVQSVLRKLLTRSELTLDLGEVARVDLFVIGFRSDLLSSGIAPLAEQFSPNC